MPPEGFALSELNPFASVRRYHEGETALTPEEIKTSIEVAKKVDQWAKSIVSC